MLKKIYKNKSLLTVILVALLIVLGMLGTDWEVGFAEETLPKVVSINPQTICAGSPDTQVTIIGEDFISVDYTWIRWLDELSIYSYIIPDEVNLAGTELIFTIDAPLLTQVYYAPFWIENHPPDSNERTGPFYIDIVGCEFVYLPLIMK